jgi:carbon dioxide concentrating mechanism protein CcmO
VSDTIGLLEVIGLTPSMVAVDAMEKAADVEVIQCELNDFYGVCTKIRGRVAAVRTAIQHGRLAAEQMGAAVTSQVLSRVDPRAVTGIVARPEYNPLIEQDVVFNPSSPSGGSKPAATPAVKEKRVANQESGFALGFIETQGFTAVFSAIDTACKAANVEIVAKEKLGGGYVTIVVKGDVASVKAAIEAGKAEVEGLGKLIAAHVIPRPSPAVLGLLPK